MSTAHAADEVLLGFTRALRAAGVAVTGSPRQHAVQGGADAIGVLAVLHRDPQRAGRGLDVEGLRAEAVMLEASGRGRA